MGKGGNGSALLPRPRAQALGQALRSRGAVALQGTCQERPVLGPVETDPTREAAGGDPVGEPLGACSGLMLLVSVAVSTHLPQESRGAVRGPVVPRGEDMCLRLAEIPRLPQGWTRGLEAGRAFAEGGD